MMTDKRKQALEALEQWDAFRGQELAGNILVTHLETIRAALTDEPENKYAVKCNMRMGIAPSSDVMMHKDTGDAVTREDTDNTRMGVANTSSGVVVVPSPTTSASGDMLEWLPIESAPRDGTYILLGRKRGSRGKQMYPTTIGRFKGRCWRTVNCHWRSDEHFIGWLPLPSPPDNVSDKGGG
jgi:hypothetical protein